MRNTSSGGPKGGGTEAIVSLASPWTHHCISLVINSQWLKAEAKISEFLKSTKLSGCDYKCLTTSVVWW